MKCLVMAWAVSGLLLAVPVHGASTASTFRGDPAHSGV